MSRCILKIGQREPHLFLLLCELGHQKEVRGVCLGVLQILTNLLHKSVRWFFLFLHHEKLF